MMLPKLEHTVLQAIATGGTKSVFGNLWRRRYVNAALHRLEVKGLVRFDYDVGTVGSYVITEAGRNCCDENGTGRVGGTK